MALRKTGLNPLAYVGVEPLTLSADVIYPRAPTQNDINFNLSTRWLDSSTQGYYILVNLAGGVAQWILLTEGGQSGITSVTTDDSAEVVANASGNINIFGTHGINTTGTADPFPNTVTVAVDNTLTLGDLSNVGASASLTLESGILDIVDGNALIGNTGANALASEVIFEKSRSGAVIDTDDDLGSVVFQGYDGTQYTTGASILAEATGIIANHQVPSNLQFSTAGGTGTLTERMTIASSGITTIAVPDVGSTSLITGAGIEVITSNVTIDAGNLNVTAGNINMPNTTAAFATGTFTMGGTPFLHDYGTNNVFLGKDAGNATLTTATATSNIGLGTNALGELTTGTKNIGQGTGTLAAITTGEFNVAIGFSAGSTYSGAESSNIIIGVNDGVNGESNVIRIGGGTGSGAGEQDKCFISGINGVTVGSPMFVTIDSATDQLGVSGTPATACAFQYKNSTIRTNVTGDSTIYTMIFDTKIFDIDSNFDGTSTFTAPVNGIYAFQCNVSLSGVGSQPVIFFGLNTTNATVDQYDFNYLNAGAIDSSGAVTLSGSCIFQLNAGEEVTAIIQVGPGSKGVSVVTSFGDPEALVTSFSGYLVMQ